MGGVDAVRSSKLRMYRQISSTSLLTGAMTSLHRNLVPEIIANANYQQQASVEKQQQNELSCSFLCANPNFKDKCMEKVS
jgi:hypothetical protein